MLRGSTNTTPATTVTINGYPPTQRSSTSPLWYYEQSVLNPDGPVRRVVDIAASNSTGGRSNGPVTTHQKGALFIPPPIETPNYDVDGNQTSDARWNYTWDGENRLIAQEEKFGIPVVQEETPGSLVQLPAATVTRKRLAFTYDSRGRRITKSVSIATGTGSFVLQQSLVFLYDGWNMIAEIDTTTSSAQLLRSYEWGTDISGTMTGAGGVGGLLMVRFYAATSTTASSSPPPPAGGYAPLYDGNGNITELFNLTYSTVSARYEYGAFGETISIDGGPVAAANPFRFSTKYMDVETGLYNYGFRYYDAVNGRWLNRDPMFEVMGEMPEIEGGGPNLYAMTGNDAINRVDVHGLFAEIKNCDCCQTKALKAHFTKSLTQISDLKAKIQAAINADAKTVAKYPKKTIDRLKYALDVLTKTAAKLPKMKAKCDTKNGSGAATTIPFGNTISFHGGYWYWVDELQAATIVHEGTHGTVGTSDARYWWQNDVYPDTGSHFITGGGITFNGYAGIASTYDTWIIGGFCIPGFNCPASLIFNSQRVKPECPGK